jgi:hypothetical protein
MPNLKRYYNNACFGQCISFLFHFFGLEQNIKLYWQVVRNTFKLGLMVEDPTRLSPFQHLVWAHDFCGTKQRLSHWTIIYGPIRLAFVQLQRQLLVEDNNAWWHCNMANHCFIQTKTKPKKILLFITYSQVFFHF